jgi:glycosyltransferase involved in cell wall biosynthesis
MNIAVNTRLLIRNKLEGIGWFTCESLKRITTRHPEHRFYFIFDRPFDEEFLFSDNVIPIVQSPPARHPLLFLIWFEGMLPGLLERLKPDLFLSPDGFLSLRSNIRSMAVLHDLNFEHYPEDLPYWVRKYYLHYFPRFAQKAVRIATVSEYSREDIHLQYQVARDRIDVVYNGANELFGPLTEEGKARVRQEFTGGSPYFVFVGALHPRKNLANLFRAFDLFRRSCDSGVKLLIVGAKKWWTRSIEEAYRAMEHRDDVIFSGRIEADRLGGILSSSIALTYVSYFEGFGIPIAEAFRCETAVITSNVTSMPEVAGDAAVITDPFDPVSIANAMIRLYKDESYRSELIRRGIARKETFTWDKTADLLWQSIEKAIQTP